MEKITRMALLAVAVLGLSACGDKEESATPTPEPQVLEEQRVWPEGALWVREDSVSRRRNAFTWDTIHIFKHLYCVYYEGVEQSDFLSSLPDNFSLMPITHLIGQHNSYPLGVYILKSRKGRTESLEQLKKVKAVFAVEPVWKVFTNVYEGDTIVSVGTTKPELSLEWVRDTLKVYSMADALNLKVLSVTPTRYHEGLVDIVLQANHSLVNAYTASNILRKNEIPAYDNETSLWDFAWRDMQE